MSLFPEDDRPKIIKTAIGDIVDPIRRFVAFIKEREAIRLRRAEGKPWPWTDDQILQENRFCNTRREHDRGTRWIAEHWRKPHANDPDLWFAMVVARLVNRSETLAALGFPASWDSKHFLQVMAARGKEIFRQEGYAGCHTAALYTNDKLTLAGLHTPAWRRPELRHPDLT